MATFLSAREKDFNPQNSSFAACLRSAKMTSISPQMQILTPQMYFMVTLQTKLSCQLTTGCDDAFQFSSEDFLNVLDNLIHFEGLIPGMREYEKLSVIHNSLSQRSIKLTQSLFKVSVYHILIYALYCDKTGLSRKSARYYYSS
jgi:hypothetical protein